MQWQRVDNKPAVVIAALGSGFVLWLSFSVLGALRFLPLVRRGIPATLELLGLAVACWFTYHYLLFKDGRERLALLLQELRERILGGIESQTRL
ncbi:hypothetical protein QBZ16_004031 [Prototheca wickerhamii]|uniref:Cyanobacterial aminoacyl-tRNA synthetase CAAD domain-containing protein n=1 Tax=Prototheca wickerhamii TaxID=3111 RepID=A0AAD9IIG9_PROWI|nr:hypothetical protein QBZ16_004031 [Prototheca wickerhamii]